MTLVQLEGRPAANVRTKSQEVAADVAALLRARNPLIWIDSREEGRVERHLFEAAAAIKYVPMFWDVAAGVTDMAGQPVAEFDGVNDPGAILDLIRAQSTRTGAVAKRRVWVLRDLPLWLQGSGGAPTLRRLRNLCRSLPSVPRENAQAIIMISTSGDVPPELSAHATVIQWPLPDRTEIGAVIDAAVASLPEFETNPVTKQPDPTRPLRANACPNGTRDLAIDASLGLTGDEVSACLSVSLAKFRRIDPVTITKEKKSVIAREKVLQWFDPLPNGLAGVGGLDNLRSWLLSRSMAYSPAARAYGLPSPKGTLTVGISGCGKSLMAKAVATAWSCPLLKLDLGALKSKFVGESEANLRKAFSVIEAIGRCIVWVDEIEKSLKGATDGSADGGVSADALGAILTWMQERRGDAFVFATSNDVSALPPELLRKGRFDELWFVDLPIHDERVAILGTALNAHGRGSIIETIDVHEVALATVDFTGSEIAELVPTALFAAFAENAREITTQDLLTAATAVVPLSKTMGEKLDALRAWGNSRARPATAPITTQATASTGRALDI